MTPKKTAALVLVLLVIGGVVALKISRGGPPGEDATIATEAPRHVRPASHASAAVAHPVAPAPPTKGQTASLPRLMEFGSTTCEQCKKMAPIIAELTTELGGKVNVEFIDTQKNEKAAAEHKIELIPTQVFLDPQGKELFRHVGFYAKAEIMAKLSELRMLPAS